MSGKGLSMDGKGAREGGTYQVPHRGRGRGATSYSKKVGKSNTTSGIAIHTLRPAPRGGFLRWGNAPNKVSSPREPTKGAP